jgi:hypothetical protein
MAEEGSASPKVMTRTQKIAAAARAVTKRMRREREARVLEACKTLREGEAKLLPNDKRK